MSKRPPTTHGPRWRYPVEGAQSVRGQHRKPLWELPIWVDARSPRHHTKTSLCQDAFRDFFPTGPCGTFSRSDRRPRGRWSKAGAILGTPVGGRFLMYFGEGCIYYAESDDLLHWTPRPEDEPVLAPEWGTFTSDLVEAGPLPAFTTDGTALLVHNMAVFHRGGGVSYSCGQVPIDPARPGIVVAKTVQPRLAPHPTRSTTGS